MQERVTPSDESFAEIVVQFNADHNSLGIGLEPRTDVPTKHFIDQIYGDPQTQTKIGRTFVDRMRQENMAIPYMPDFVENDPREDEWFNNFGRMILDAVSGSSMADGLWTWLDRPGSNRLIRLIRKGRDISFGADA